MTKFSSPHLDKLIRPIRKEYKPSHHHLAVADRMAARKKRISFR